MENREIEIKNEDFAFQRLFNYFKDEHDLTLLQSELQDIIHICNDYERCVTEDEKKSIWKIIKNYGSAIPVNVAISMFNDIINHYKK